MARRCRVEGSTALRDLSSPIVRELIHYGDEQGLLRSPLCLSLLALGEDGIELLHALKLLDYAISEFDGHRVERRAGRHATPFPVDGTCRPHPQSQRGREHVLFIPVDTRPYPTARVVVACCHGRSWLDDKLSIAVDRAGRVLSVVHVTSKSSIRSTDACMQGQCSREDSLHGHRNSSRPDQVARRNTG